MSCRPPRLSRDIRDLMHTRALRMLRDEDGLLEQDRLGHDRVERGSSGEGRGGVRVATVRKTLGVDRGVVQSVCRRRHAGGDRDDVSGDQPPPTMLCGKRLCGLRPTRAATRPSMSERSGTHMSDDPSPSPNPDRSAAADAEDGDGRIRNSTQPTFIAASQTRHWARNAAGQTLTMEDSS